MMTNLTCSTNIRSPVFRVMMSHFSGVEMITWVYSIWFLVKCTSPVNSFTVIPKILSLFPKFPVISETKAFIGAI